MALITEPQDIPEDEAQELQEVPTEPEIPLSDLVSEPPGTEGEPELLNSEEAFGPVLFNTDPAPTENPYNTLGIDQGGFTGPLFDTTSSQETIDQAFRTQARQQQTLANRQQQINNGDWRVRLRLAPRANYLYNARNPGILQPLQVTDGVVFPYTPSIETAYRANYDNYDLTHSNYRGYFYKSSNIDAININAVFTAQDTAEANYLLAVIHFFRSATKMFYGQDAERGAPPPVVYLSGLGPYQFNNHSCVISSFNYSLPDGVDYIRAQAVTENGTNLTTQRDRANGYSGTISPTVNRLLTSFLSLGALPNVPTLRSLGNASNDLARGGPTYVPTKMNISLSLLPIQSRQQVSKQFSVKEFANGNLLRGGFW